MTAKQQRAVLDEHLAYWRPRLCPEWLIALKHEPNPVHPDARMVSDRADSYLAATIWVKPPAEWRIDAEEWGLATEVEVTLVHELIHSLCHDVQEQHDAVGEHMGREAWRVQRRSFMHHLERLVDRTARALVAGRYGFNPTEGPTT